MAAPTWRQQAVASLMHLQAVFFIDARRGWAVGGYCQPGSAPPVASCFAPTTAASTWLKLPQPLLPLLTGVKFFDRDRGIAFGQIGLVLPIGRFCHARWRRNLATAPRRSARQLVVRRFSRARCWRPCRSSRPNRYARTSQNRRFAARGCLVAIHSVPCDLPLRQMAGPLATADCC